MTFAQFVGDGSTGIIGALNAAVVPIIIGLALLAFIWGVIHYFILHGHEEAKRAEGHTFLLWAVLGMVVLFSVWGLVNIALSTLGIAPSSSSSSTTDPTTNAFSRTIDNLFGGTRAELIDGSVDRCLNVTCSGNANCNPRTGICSAPPITTSPQEECDAQGGAWSFSSNTCDMTVNPNCRVQEDLCTTPSGVDGTCSRIGVCRPILDDSFCKRFDPDGRGDIRCDSFGQSGKCDANGTCQPDTIDHSF